mgnify:FL=1
MSILKQTLAHNMKALSQYACEFIVVDDASTDESVAFLKTEFADVKVVALRTNSRFSAACNAGIKAASHAYILLLNNDMLIHELDLPKILAYLDEEDCFSVTPKIIRKQDRDVNESVGMAWFKGGMVRTENVSMIRPDYPFKEKELVFWGCGGALFLSKEKFEMIDGFDPILFHPFYCEDLDLCYRASLRGWKNYYSTLGNFEHFHQQTIGKLSPSFVRKIHDRNKYFFIWKNIRDPFMLGSHALSILVYLLTFRFRELYLVLLCIVRLPDIIKQGRKNLRLKTDKELFAPFLDKYQLLKSR